MLKTRTTQEQQVDNNSAAENSDEIAAPDAEIQQQTDHENPAPISSTSTSTALPVPENAMHAGESASIARVLRELQELKKSVSSLTETPQRPGNVTRNNTNRESQISQPNFSTQIRSTRCMSELLNIDVIQQNFSLHEKKLMCLLCHVNDSDSAVGVSVPASDDLCLVNKNGRTVQTKAFLNTKQNVISHLMCSTHSKSLEKFSEDELGEKRLKSKNSIAGLSIATLIYSMVLRKDSYASYEHRVLACSLIPGTYMGDINHSRKFVPEFLKTMAVVLQKRFIDYLKKWDNLLGFSVPVSITADKDTNRHRSRQVLSLREF